MSVPERLTQVFNVSLELPFNNYSKIILMSDCHRGDGSRADDFVPNEQVFLTALKNYYYHGYTYIELGDGDELWQFEKLPTIIKAHSEVFRWLYKLQLQKRYYPIWGNHDIYKKEQRFWKELRSCGKQFPLLYQTEAYEGIILGHFETRQKIFLIHGHQADPFNDRAWRISCFLARYLWRPMELYFGINDPISPAKNHHRKTKIENHLVDWVNANHQILIAGHTHRPLFPGAGEPPYFNCGSCLHPDGITGMEIAGGKIALVKWSYNRNKGESFIYRKILAGPKPLVSFFHDSFISQMPVINSR